MGLTQPDVSAIKVAYDQTFLQAQDALVNANAFLWQGFTTYSAPSKTTCSSFFERECGPNPRLLNAAWAMEFTNTQSPDATIAEDLATFLLARGDLAWIGV